MIDLAIGAVHLFLQQVFMSRAHLASVHVCSPGARDLVGPHFEEGILHGELSYLGSMSRRASSSSPRDVSQHLLDSLQWFKLHQQRAGAHSVLVFFLNGDVLMPNLFLAQQYNAGAAGINSVFLTNNCQNPRLGILAQAVGARIRTLDNVVQIAQELVKPTINVRVCHTHNSLRITRDSQYIDFCFTIIV
jgi:hypothetical protein